ncbi:uncharacterized protein B0T23DRAFT_385209 [Neurospora hispaniola]|uniref:Uncharacterized protein n=1 Tax=Neurospora hispaniola TaxID=588809 RepID=A0AAJ0I4I8_9PEZI|nr:hypothetical protein B0T23DRAFT_385209 [Neurospora hispaniola]
MASFPPLPLLAASPAMLFHLSLGGIPTIQEVLAMIDDAVATWGENISSTGPGINNENTTAMAFPLLFPRLRC